MSFGRDMHLGVLFLVLFLFLRVVSSIYIKKNGCPSVCLFVVHSVPVLASVTKLSMVPPQAQRKVMAGSPRGYVGEISPRSSDTSVRSNRDTYRHQTFHTTFLGPKESRHVV